MARENKNWAKAKFTPLLKKKLIKPVKKVVEDFSATPRASRGTNRTPAKKKRK